MKSEIQLSVITPTYCERDNIAPFIEALEGALKDISWELVFVDDNSPDGTADEVRLIARHDRRVRCIQRIGRRGLSTACIEGMLASSGSVIAVIDADMQHDEKILPAMLSTINTGADLVIGTRYAEGGSVGDWSKKRLAMSRLATRMSSMVCKRTVSDPMSGFFMLKRDLFVHVSEKLSGLGFKILMDILSSAPRVIHVTEIPYTFRDRHSGVSKLDATVLWEYGMLLADKMIGRLIPVRLISFGLVGLLGVGIHLITLYAFMNVISLTFQSGQIIATIVAMTSNFALNNLLTYRDKRLRGLRWVTGLFIFYCVCSLGAVANVGVSGFLFGRETGWLLSALAGIAVGTVWNYAASNAFAWGQTARKG